MNGLSRLLRQLFTPNEVIAPRLGWLVIAGWVIVFLAYWNLGKPAVIPAPTDVLAALPALWTQGGLGQELISSFMVNLQGMFFAILLSLPLAYLSRTPAMAPLAHGLAKLRFLSPAVFFMVLLFMFSTGHEVKVAMLAIGETFFLVTTMNGIMEGIQLYQLDDARTLRMSEWQTVWYVNVRGTLAQAIDAIRDNAAMGWAMLVMVEGIVRSEGGVGVMMLNQEKHVNFAEVYAIALAILLVGIGQDYALSMVRKAVCPYAEAR
jgi:NitT/TauT family transport system permease protein